MKILINNKPFHFSPTQILVLGFASVILAGAILLTLPLSTIDGQGLSIIDALFESTSAVCVTGLVVINTARDLSLFGQLTMITLIQIGGLGFMTMATMVFLMLGKRITLRERLVMQEALNQFTLEGVVRLTRSVIFTTLAIEGLGAIILSIKFIPMVGWLKGIYFSIFHSISAFCNAGFDLLGDSLVDYSGDIILNFTIMGLIILGGIGFSVIWDVYYNGRNIKRWSLHTKLVILITLILILFGFLFIFFIEYNKLLMDYPLGRKIIASLFHSVTSRTAGFNSISVGDLTDASKFITIILMFIGASPASTGGGIKTTTAFIILLTVKSVIEGKNDIEIFGRGVSHSIAKRALAIAFISLGVLIAVTVVFTIVEPYPFIDLLFQTSTALGTVGLASFDNSKLTNISKVFTILCMFAGRLGPLTLTSALAKRQLADENHIKYPKGRVMVG